MRFTRSVEVIPLDHIRRDPRQPRDKFNQSEIEALARSIQAEGLLQPSTIRPDPRRDGYYILVAGERRFRALQLNKETEYEFIVIRGLEGNLGNSFIASVVENLHRVDLNPIEEAKACKRLMDEHGMSFAEISNLTGRGTETIKNKLALLELPEEIQQMVIDGKLPQGGSINLAQFRGTKGETIRRAMALAAGKTPLELGIVYHTGPGGVGTRVQIPTTAEAKLQRILAFSWRLKGELTIIEAFLALADEDKLRAMRGLMKRALEGLKITMQEAEQFTRLFNEFAKANPVYGLSEEHVIEQGVRQFNAQQPAPYKQLSDRQIQERSRASYAGENGNGNGSKNYPSPRSFPLDELTRAATILSLMFPSGTNVNLRKGYIATGLQKSKVVAERMALQALRVAGSWWREPIPAEHGPKRDLTLVVTRLRVSFPEKHYSLGGPSCFGGFIQTLKNTSDYASPESINLEEL